jgi:hypothetical protein
MLPIGGEHRAVPNGVPGFKMVDKPYISLTSEFGLVVRRAALEEGGVSWADLLAALEVSEPLDENAYLISFGPHFGEEAMDTMNRRLIGIGLEYFDDFFEFSGPYPEWCIFKGGSPG